MGNLKLTIFRYKEIITDFWYRIARFITFVQFPYRDLSKPRYKFREYDTWSIDLVFSRFIADGIQKFIDVSKKDEFFSVPHVTTEEWKESNELQEKHKTSGDYWLWILNEILWAMKNPEEPDYEGEFDDFMPSDGDKWNKHVKYLKEYEERHEKARFLLAKYWKCLWW